MSAASAKLHSETRRIPSFHFLLLLDQSKSCGFDGLGLHSRSATASLASWIIGKASGDHPVSSGRLCQVQQPVPYVHTVAGVGAGADSTAQACARGRR